MLVDSSLRSISGSRRGVLRFGVFGISSKTPPRIVNVTLLLSTILSLRVRSPGGALQHIAFYSFVGAVPLCRSQVMSAFLCVGFTAR